MERKKVKSDSVIDDTPKKRDDNSEPVSENVRWDKINNVTGKIIRYKLGDKEKSIEIGNMVLKNEVRKLYSAIDNDIMYFYYEIINNKK